MSGFIQKLKNSLGGQRLKIARAVMGVALSAAMLVAASVSFAWFSNNRDVNGAGMGIDVRREGVDVEFEYFKYDMNGQSYVSASDLSSIEFNQYDLVFRSRNNYTPIVIRFSVNKAQLPDNGTLVANIYRDINADEFVTEGGKKKMSKFSSSVMRFTPYINPSYYSATASTQFTNVHDPNYNTVRAYTGSTQGGTQVFTTVSYSDNTINSIEKEDVVSLRFDFVKSNFAGDTVFAYIYVTYDEGFNAGSYNGLMGIYLKTAGYTSLNEESVKFDNDFTAVEIMLGTGQGA